MAAQGITAAESGGTASTEMEADWPAWLVQHESGQPLEIEHRGG
jgi:hypothetical protein